MTGLQLQLVYSQQGEQVIRLEQDRMGKFYELLDYWQNQPKLTMQFKVGDQEQNFQYVLTPPSLLKYIDSGEKFGAYIADMMFISSDIAREHVNWVPYVALKLYAEKFVPNAEMDESGVLKHHETLYRTVRLAAATMNEDKLYEFLSELRKHERSGYMQIDEEAQEFLDRAEGNFLEGKRKYLENHHRNFWVNQGRMDEDLTHLGIMFSGYRNHAQAAFNALASSNAVDIYLASAFMTQLVSVDPNVPIIITSPFSSFAYAMTKEANGVVDLVEFKHYPNSKCEDMIVRRPGKMKTWTALRKRLSYEIHRLELNVQKQIENDKKSLEQLMLEAEHTNNALTMEIQQIRSLALTKPLFGEARNTLASLSGKYRTQVAALDQASQNIATRLSELEELSDLLVANI